MRVPAFANANQSMRAHGLPVAGLIVGGACRRATLADGAQNAHSGAVEAVMLALERPSISAAIRAQPIGGLMTERDVAVRVSLAQPPGTLSLAGRLPRL